MDTVLILEDYLTTREWLVTIVNEAYPECDIFQAGTLADARQLSQRPINLALVDLNLPDGSGVDFIIWLNNLQPDAYIVVATIYDDEEHLFKALKAGALGYLLKEDSKETLVTALKGVIDGQPPLSAAIARKIISQFQANKPSDLRDPGSAQFSVINEDAALTGDKSSALTVREEQVLNLVAKGFNRREVAEYLTISTHTAASHVKSIYRKLNVGSRAEVALEARRLGLT